MGVIYHGNFFRYFEEARRVLMETQYSYRDMQDSGYMWPIIDTRVKYVKAIPFNHTIRITAQLTGGKPLACGLRDLRRRNESTYVQSAYNASRRIH